MRIRRTKMSPPSRLAPTNTPPKTSIILPDKSALGPRAGSRGDLAATSIWAGTNAGSGSGFLGASFVATVGTLTTVGVGEFVRGVATTFEGVAVTGAGRTITGCATAFVSGMALVFATTGVAGSMIIVVSFGGNEGAVWIFSAPAFVAFCRSASASMSEIETTSPSGFFGAAAAT